MLSIRYVIVRGSEYSTKKYLTEFLSDGFPTYTDFHRIARNFTEFLENSWNFAKSLKIPSNLREF